MSIRPAAFARALAACAVVLVALSLGGQLLLHGVGHDPTSGLVKLFNLDGEMNIPAFYATLLLLVAAGLLAVIARVERSSAQMSGRAWSLLSLLFVYLALDENVSLHEKLIAPMRTLLGSRALGVLYFAWVVPAACVLLALVPLFARFAAHLPPRTRSAFVLAAGLFVGGGLGLELVGGGYAEAHGVHRLEYAVITAAEEFLEMAGVIVFVYALLTYLARSRGEVRFALDASGPALAAAHDEAAEGVLGLEEPPAEAKAV